MSTNSFTTLTLELSRAPCTTFPKLPSRGFATIASPLAGVSTKKLSPMGCRPFLFWNSANSICPTSSCSTAPGSCTATTPSEDTLISCASSGITISGWITKPL